MFNFIKKLLRRTSLLHTDVIRARVCYSVEKYEQAYKLLEKYDPTAAKKTEILSERKHVQDYLRRLQTTD